MMQLDPGVLILLILASITPQIIALWLSYRTWGWVSGIHQHIVRGMCEYNGLPPQGEAPWEKTYASYLENPRKYTIGLRGIVFATGLLVGIAISVSAPLYGVETVWGLHPMAMVIFGGFGLFLALNLKFNQKSSSTPEQAQGWPPSEMDRDMEIPRDDIGEGKQ